MTAPTTARRGDDLLLTVLAVGGGLILGVAALVWLAGQLAALLLHGHWPAAPLSASPAILLHLAGHPADPAAAWPTIARATIPGPLAVYTVLTLLLAGVGGLAVVALVKVTTYRAGKPARDRDRSTAWARAPQLRHLAIRRPDGQRVTLGRLGRTLIAAEPRRSVLVVAPTQAGKTTRFVVPTLATWTGPMVVTSVKPDVLLTTYAHRHRVTGGAVVVFDPTRCVDPSLGIRTARWSPLLASVTYPAAEDTARWLAQAAQDAQPETNAKFWESLAVKLLAPMLYAAANTTTAPGQPAHMGTVARWVDRRETADASSILAVLDDEDAVNAFTAATTRENRSRDNAFSTAETVLQAFTSPTVRQQTTITADADIVDAGWLLDHTATLYLVAPEKDHERFAPLFTALIQTVVHEAQRRHAASGRPLDPALMLLLDEAAHVAPLRTLPTIAATGAGQGIQLCTVWQDLTQIQTVYKSRARTLVNNHTARVYLPGQGDFSTLDEVSKVLGEHTVERRTHSVDDTGRATRSHAAHQVRLAPPDYLRTLPADTAIVVYGRDPAMRLTTIPWFDDPKLRAALADGRPPSTAGVPPPRRPQPASGLLPPAVPRPPTGADPSLAQPQEAAMPRPVDPDSRYPYAGQHSTIAGLVPDPDDPDFAYDPSGRRYYVNRAVDGTPIARPVELNDDERAELDAARDRANAYAEQLHAAARREQEEVAGGQVIPLPLPWPPAGDP